MDQRSFYQGFHNESNAHTQNGIQDYECFAKDALALIRDKSINFEVFSDDFPTMEKQARQSTFWGKNVSVKSPVSNTGGVSAATLIHTLSANGISINVTAS